MIDEREYPFFSRALHHLPCFAGIHRHGLFTQHRFAGIQRAERHFAVRHYRCDDTHQVDVITLNGPVGLIGEVFSVTITDPPAHTSPVTISYRTTGDEPDLTTIVDKLVSKIANYQPPFGVTATNLGNGQLELRASTGFTSHATVQNVATVETIQRTVVPVAQQDEIGFPGPLDAGDQYTITFTAPVGGPFTVTTASTDNEAAIAAKFVSAINAAGIGVTASVRNGRLSIVSDTPGSAMTYTATLSTDAAPNVTAAPTTATGVANIPAGPLPQIDTVQLSGPVGRKGDIYEVTVNGRTIRYTTTGNEADIDAILDVPGIDVVYIGVNDLSYSFGDRGKQTPQVVAAVAKVVAAAKQRNLVVGRPTSAADVKTMYDRTREALQGMGLLAPTVLILLGLVLYPFFYAIYLSMLNRAETEFVWFDNFLFLPFYPLWSLVIIALSIFVIWSLATTLTARTAGVAERAAMAAGGGPAGRDPTRDWAAMDADQTVRASLRCARIRERTESQHRTSPSRTDPATAPTRSARLNQPSAPTAARRLIRVTPERVTHLRSNIRAVARATVPVMSAPSQFQLRVTVAYALCAINH